MTRRTVNLPADVQATIDAQALYIAQDSPDRALAWQQRVDVAVRGLGDFAGFAVDQAASDRIGYPVHKLVFERAYLIFYRIDEAANAVFVLHFRHGATRPGPGEP
jgi:plasmid stabilization system protein ParE